MLTVIIIITIDDSTPNVTVAHLYVDVKSSIESTSGHKKALIQVREKNCKPVGKQKYEVPVETWYTSKNYYDGKQLDRKH